MKVSNMEVQEKTGLSHTQVYYMQNKKPLDLIMIKKGILADRLLSDRVMPDFTGLDAVSAYKSKGAIADNYLHSDIFVGVIK